MFYSIYPSDSDEVLEEIAAQAQQFHVSHYFISLHIPEASSLNQFLDKLKDFHERYNFTYTADISPNMFDMLNIPSDDLRVLKTYGITGLRLDFGFETEVVASFQKQGFEISMNASTITDMILKDLNGTEIIGWHNFYPRPYTGISEEFLEKQNELVRGYHYPLKAFVPGDKHRRIPLHLGLPTLETHRDQNAYVSYIELRKKHGIEDVGVAEGVLDTENISKIMKYEDSGVITLPIECMQEVSKMLTEREFKVRIEESDISWRLEDTRAFGKEDFSFYSEKPAETLEYGGIYFDSSEFGRYKGEVHICLTKEKVPMGMHKVGTIKEEYLSLIPLLTGSPMIQFEI